MGQNSDPPRDAPTRGTAGPRSSHSLSQSIRIKTVMPEFSGGVWFLFWWGQDRASSGKKGRHSPPPTPSLEKKSEGSYLTKTQNSLLESLNLSQIMTSVDEGTNATCLGRCCQPVLLLPEQSATHHAESLSPGWLCPAHLLHLRTPSYSGRLSWQRPALQAGGPLRGTIQSCPLGMEGHDSPFPWSALSP